MRYFLFTIGGELALCIPAENEAEAWKDYKECYEEREELFPPDLKVEEISKERFLKINRPFVP